MNEQENEIQEAQSLIPRPSIEGKQLDLSKKIQSLNSEINEVNESIAYHHNQADAKKELKVTLEDRREHLMKEFREQLGERM